MVTEDGAEGDNKYYVMIVLEYTVFRYTCNGCKVVFPDGLDVVRLSLISYNVQNFAGCNFMTFATEIRFAKICSRNLMLVDLK